MLRLFPINVPSKDVNVHTTNLTSIGKKETNNK